MGEHGPSPDHDPAASRTTTTRRVRSVFSVLAALVALLGLVTTLVAVWARGTLFDSDEVGDAVQTALSDPAVTDALATYLSDQIVVAVGAETFLVDVLPPALEPLAPAITGGVRTYVTDRLAAVLADEDVRAVIVVLAERAHASLMRLLDGEGIADGITIADGEVTVNLLPLITRGLLVVQELGLLQRIEVPTFTADGDPDAQRAELAEALGRDLPAEFGELVVYRSEAVAQAESTLAVAQRAVVLAKRALVALAILTVVAGAVSIWLAQRRARAALLLALAAVALMVIVRGAGRRVIDESPTLVLQPGARAAVAAIVGSLADGLITTASVVAVAGALAALVLWATGDSGGAQRLRGVTGSATGALGGIGPIVASHRDAVVFTGYAAALVILLVGGLGAVPLLLAVAVALGGFLLARFATADS